MNSPTCRRFQCLLATFGFIWAAGFPPTAALAKPGRADTAATPETLPRLVIIATRLPDPEAPPTAGRSRELPVLDSYGFRRGPGEPRFFLGSLTKQKAELYGNVVNTAAPLFIFTQSDLRKGGGRFLGGPFGDAYSEQAERTRPPLYELDLRRVPRAKRRAALAQLIGPERADQAIAEARARLAAEGGRR